MERLTEELDQAQAALTDLQVSSVDPVHRAMAEQAGVSVETLSQSADLQITRGGVKRVADSDARRMAKRSNFRYERERLMKSAKRKMTVFKRKAALNMPRHVQTVLPMPPSCRCAATHNRALL